MIKYFGEIDDEWNSLPSAPPTQCKKYCYETAYANHNLNRYPDVLPFEKTRVILNNNQQIYINASYIEIITNYRFIASQAPLPQSFNCFWEMIWEKNVSIIVMLSRFVEKRKVKAHCYWPHSIDSPEDFNDITVILTKKKKLENEGIIIHYFTIIKDKQTHNVTHLHYINWPDFGVPITTDSIRLLKKLTEKYLKNDKKMEIDVNIDINTTNNTTYPILVHCSAGIGRAGTFLAFLNYCELIKRGKTHEELSIGRIVSSLRNQRMCMVQTKEQFQFIYKLILDEYNLEIPHSCLTPKLSQNLLPILPDKPFPNRRKILTSSPSTGVIFKSNRSFLRTTHSNLNLSLST